MKTSIATVCLSGGLAEKLQAIAAAGFKGVEIFENDLLSFNGTPEDVLKNDDVRRAELLTQIDPADVLKNDDVRRVYLGEQFAA